MLASWVSNKASNWSNTNDSPVALGRKWADVQKRIVQRITSKIRDMIPVGTLSAVWEQVWDREQQEKRKTYTIQNSTLKCWLIMCTNAGKVVSVPTIASRLDVLNQVQQKNQSWFLTWGASSLNFFLFPSSVFVPMQTFKKELLLPRPALPLGMCSDLQICGFFQGG